MSSEYTLSEYGQGDGTYQALGRLEGITKLVKSFYYFMDTLEKAHEIRAMHTRDLSDSERKLAYFLSGWTGGPKLYSQHFGSIRIPLAHQHLAVTHVQSDAWLSCMRHALAEQAYPESLQKYMLRELKVPADRIVAAGRKA